MMPYNRPSRERGGMAMSRQSMWISIVLSTSMLALAACGGNGYEQAKIAQEDLVGTWVNGAEGRMAFAADHTFRFNSVKLKSDIYPSCPDGDSTGEWEFFVGDGESLTSDSDATSGKAASLHFNGQALGACVISMSFVDSGKSLCLSDDPDDVCNLGLIFSRESSQ